MKINQLTANGNSLHSILNDCYHMSYTRFFYGLHWMVPYRENKSSNSSYELTDFSHKLVIGTNIHFIHDFHHIICNVWCYALPYHITNPFTHSAGPCSVNTLATPSGDAILRNSSVLPHKSDIGTGRSLQGKAGKHLP